MAGDADGTDEMGWDLHRQVRVSAIDTTGATTANGEAQRVPSAALDALIETAWAFPGFRVSFGAFDGPRAIRFFTSAGAERMANLNGIRLDVRTATRLIDSLRSSELALAIEDVESDSRTRPIAEGFIALDTRAVLILPLRRAREPQPIGVVMMDCDAPRTWGPKESAALERLAPLISLTLEHVEVCAALETTRASASQNDRRVSAVRGLVAGVSHDAARLTRALVEIVGPAAPRRNPASTQSLVQQLSRLMEELDGIQQGPTASWSPAPCHLGVVVSEMAPALEALVGQAVRVQIRGQDPELMAGAHRTGVERMLVNLVSHAARSPGEGSIVIEARCHHGVPQVVLRGDGLQFDGGVELLGTVHGLVTADQLGASLWQVRCEALLQSVTIDVCTEDTAAITLSLPEAVVPHSFGAAQPGR